MGNLCRHKNYSVRVLRNILAQKGVEKVFYWFRNRKRTIYQYSVFEPNDSPLVNRKGYGHIAFRVDDVRAVRDEVLKRGGAELGQVVEADLPGVGHLTFVYLTDPEGNILEIQNWS